MSRDLSIEISSTNKDISRAIWANSPVSNAGFMSEYYNNSLERESEEMEQIKAAVREAGAFVVLGYSERYKGTLYISQVSHFVPSLLV